MPRLIITKGDDKGKVFELHEGRNPVGRGPHNPICIPDPSVSTNHAELIYEGDRIVLRDLGSTNGTRVNGQKTTENELKNGDEIWFGTITLRFEMEAPKPPARPQSAGIRLEEIGVAQSPPPEKVSSGFQKTSATKRTMPPPIIIVIGGLAVILLILLAIWAKLLVGH